ncbi:MAG: hypothetical protein AB7G28_05130 [Pirellulales bacterium]
MKAHAAYFILIAALLLFSMPEYAAAGLDVVPVPEPTAILVWAALAGLGGLFFWRRNRDAE